MLTFNRMRLVVSIFLLNANMMWYRCQTSQFEFVFVHCMVLGDFDVQLTERLVESMRCTTIGQIRCCPIFVHISSMFSMMICVPAEENKKRNNGKNGKMKINCMNTLDFVNISSDETEWN